MGAPYGQDLRDRVLGAYDRGMKTKQISGLFGVSSAWARRIKQVRREQNRLTPLPMGGVRVIKIDLEQLRKLVDGNPTRQSQSCISSWEPIAAVNRRWAWRWFAWVYLLKKDDSRS